MIRYSTPSILTSVPDPFAEQHPVALLQIDRDEFSGLVAATWTDRNHFSLRRAVSGIMIPPAVLPSASMRVTTTRS
jgi:hypothetical protein